MASQESNYAWLVVFCSFMLHFITDGVTYTFGIFFTALLKDFQSSKALAAWVPSIMTGITYGVGPIASALTNRYGCRAIAIVGTTLSALGFLLSTLADNVVTLYVTIGVLSGFGFGLIYLPAIVCLTQHFSRHLALATGLAVSASGIGTALFAPLTEQLVQRNGWRLAMQIIALLLLLSGLFALSFRQPEELDDDTESSAQDSADDDDDSRQKIVQFHRSRQCSIDSLKAKKDRLCNGSALYLNCDLSKSQSLSKDSLPSGLASGQLMSVIPEVPHISTAIHSISTVEPTSPQSAGPFPHPPPMFVSSTQFHHSHSNLANSFNKSNCNGTVASHSSTPMYKSHGNLHSHHNSSIGRTEILLTAPIAPLDSIVLYSTSLTSVNFCADPHSKCIEQVHSRRSSVATGLYPESGRSRHQSITNSGLSGLSLEKNCTTVSTRHEPSSSRFSTICKALHVLLQWNLLRNPIFVWFVLSNFLSSLGYNVPHIYIKERCLALDQPVASDQCSYLLSLIGVSSTVGRILFGFLSDFERCNRLMLYSHCLLFCGLATALTPFAYNYWLLALFCVVFGLTTGAFVSLTTVILVDLIGVSKLTNAFGLLLLFQGVASLTGPPVIGLLYDLTRSYNEGFMFAGIAIALSGLMLYFVPFLRQKHAVIDLN